ALKRTGRDDPTGLSRVSLGRRRFEPAGAVRPVAGDAHIGDGGDLLAYQFEYRAAGWRREKKRWRVEISNRYGKG
ncbi:MAG: hypothetical protein KDD75_10575, partial [Caldilineaceae bacterium]|nr:hypothetical protein [Caldilineaceae bacterium]